MRVLMMLAWHDQLGDVGHRTGSGLEDGADTYFVFRDADVRLTLASPKGGQPGALRSWREQSCIPN
jgi:hypothetical protein